MFWRRKPSLELIIFFASYLFRNVSLFLIFETDYPLLIAIISHTVVYIHSFLPFMGYLALIHIGKLI